MTLLAAPANLRGSWWHNRDYGVFVANPFGRAAMKQGDRSKVRVARRQLFRAEFPGFRTMPRNTERNLRGNGIERCLATARQR